MFEDWVSPIIETMHKEQDEKWTEWAHAVGKSGSVKNDDLPERFVWTPSKLIHRLGLEINNKN